MGQKDIESLFKLDNNKTNECGVVILVSKQIKFRITTIKICILMNDRNLLNVDIS